MEENDACPWIHLEIKTWFFRYFVLVDKQLSSSKSSGSLALLVVVILVGMEPSYARQG